MFQKSGPTELETGCDVYYPGKYLSDGTYGKFTPCVRTSFSSNSKFMQNWQHGMNETSCIKTEKSDGSNMSLRFSHIIMQMLNGYKAPEMKMETEELAGFEAHQSLGTDCVSNYVNCSRTSLSVESELLRMSFPLETSERKVDIALSGTNYVHESIPQISKDGDSALEVYTQTDDLPEIKMERELSDVLNFQNVLDTKLVTNSSDCTSFHPPIDPISTLDIAVDCSEPPPFEDLKEIVEEFLESPVSVDETSIDLMTLVSPIDGQSVEQSLSLAPFLESKKFPADLTPEYMKQLVSSTIPDETSEFKVLSPEILGEDSNDMTVVYGNENINDNADNDDYSITNEEYDSVRIDSDDLVNNPDGLQDLTNIIFHEDFDVDTLGNVVLQSTTKLEKLDLSPIKIKQENLEISPTKVKIEASEISPVKVKQEVLDIFPTKMKQEPLETSPSKIKQEPLSSTEEENEVPYMKVEAYHPFYDHCYFPQQLWPETSDTSLEIVDVITVTHEMHDLMEGAIQVQRRRGRPQKPKSRVPVAVKDIKTMRRIATPPTNTRRTYVRKTVPIRRAPLRNRCANLEPDDTERRAYHNASERNRRASLRDSYEVLRKLVPYTKDKPKTPKKDILQISTRYIEELKHEGRKTYKELENLVKRNAAARKWLERFLKAVKSQKK